MAAATRDPRERRRLVGRARADARAIAAEGTPWGAPLGLLVEAALAAIEGRVHEAVAKLADAEGRLGAQRIGLYAAAARLRRGELLGGDEGRAVVAAADEDMRSRGVRDPVRMTAMLAPGFADVQKIAGGG
jgi:hypothetical protein